MRCFLLSTLVVLGILVPPASAQCPRVSFAKYGTTCAFFNQHAVLDARFDAQTCTAVLTLGSSRTCCNTFLSLQALFVSLTKIDPGIRHPLLINGCLLSVVPDLVFVAPRSAGGVFLLPMAGLPAKITFYAQGLNDYFTTIGFSHDYQTSQGLQIDLL